LVCLITASCEVASVYIKNNKPQVTTVIQSVKRKQKLLVA